MQPTCIMQKFAIEKLSDREGGREAEKYRIQKISLL